MMTSNPKKILQIKKGEYLLEILENGKGIKSTYNKDIALNVSNWSLEQLGHIVSNLQKVGYTKARVLTIKEEVKESLKVLAENTSDTAERIGKALKDVKERVDYNA